MVSGLVSQGMSARAVAISGTDHGRLNREIGTQSGAQATAAIDEFLADLFE